VWYGKGQAVAQPPSHEPFWHPNEWYNYRDGLPSHPTETSCNDKPLEDFQRWPVIEEEDTMTSQLIGLKKRIHLGISSSWDSRPAISVRSTESSVVTTMCYCECRVNCSVWRETGNISLRSRKGFQWMRICWVTLWCYGMTATSVLETDLSSLSKETSKRSLSCGSERGTPPFCWETSSWEHSVGLDPTLTCDWDCVQTFLQSYYVRSLQWMSRSSRSGDDDHDSVVQLSCCLLWIDEAKANIKPIYECRCNERL
jgi:hypothetical protein